MIFLVKVWRSATNFRFYREIAFQKVSRSFGYFFLFIFLITLILSMKFSNVLIRGISEVSREIGVKLPEIRIENGVVSTDAREPFVIKEKDFIVIIDTTGKTTTIDPSYKQGILLTRNKLFYKQSEIETREYNLSKIKSFTLNRESLKRWKEVISRFAFPILLVSLYSYFIVAKLIQILLLSLIALIINAATKANLKYENLFNISLFALTPPVLLATILTLAGFKIPLLGLLYIAIYMVFLIGGIKSSKGQIIESTPQ